MSLEAVIAMSLICGVIVAAIGYDRGRGLREGFLLLTRLDEMVTGALIRLWRSSWSSPIACTASPCCWSETGLVVPHARVAETAADQIG